MKRLFCISLLFSSVLLLLLCPSCGKNDPAPFTEDRYPINCDLIICTENGELSAHLYLDLQEATLQLKGDERTEGIAFSLDRDGNATISFQELTLPIAPERLPEQGLLFSLLRLSEDTPLLKSKAELDGDKCLLYTLVESDRNVLFYLDEQGTLLKMTIEQDHPVTILFQNHAKKP